MTDESNNKTEVTKASSRKSSDAELVEKTFKLTIDTLPAALAEAITTLAHVAYEMKPDDIALDLDLPAGLLHFRAYRRTQIEAIIGK